MHTEYSLCNFLKEAKFGGLRMEISFLELHEDALIQEDMVIQARQVSPDLLLPTGVNSSTDIFMYSPVGTCRFIQAIPF